MNWDDARFFLTALRAGSLSAAAKELGCSHSTVRRRIQGLEHSLGTELFVAASDGLVATDAALGALPHAEAIEAAALAFGRQLTGRSDALTGRITVTTIDVLVEWLAPALDLYRGAHPGVAVELITDNSRLDLARREADVAIRATSRPPEALFGRKVGRFENAPFAAATLAEAYVGRESEIPWVLFTKASGAKLTERWYAEWSGGRDPVVRVTNAGAMLALVRAGLGGALMPVSLASAKRLVQLGPALPELGSDIWCLTHYDLRQSARVREFMRCVSEARA